MYDAAGSGAGRWCFEPPGPAWLPVAVWLSARWHIVYRVSSQKAADFRRFLSRHAKSNGIDALRLTLTKLAADLPQGVAPDRSTARHSCRPAPARAHLGAGDRGDWRRKAGVPDLARQPTPQVARSLHAHCGLLGRSSLDSSSQWAGATMADRTKRARTRQVTVDPGQSEQVDELRDADGEPVDIVVVVSPCEGKSQPNVETREGVIRYDLTPGQHCTVENGYYKADGTPVRLALRAKPCGNAGKQGNDTSPTATQGPEKPDISADIAAPDVSAPNPRGESWQDIDAPF